MELPNRYDHSKEEDIYRRWEKSGEFEPSGNGEVFSIITPPANLTGDLHLGHALTFAIEDTIARNKRRLGYKVLILPGVDHAGIGTQMVLEKELVKKGQSRQKLGREKFTQELWRWVDLYLPRVTGAMKKFGTSCDWKHFRFTFDDQSIEAVTEAFIQLYKKDLIYRESYLVNWDPKLQTAISDDEVAYQEVPGHLYWIKYGPITVATTRPETKLGDTAIAVHPKDKRYQKYIDTEIEFTNEAGKKQKLPVIADEIVDQEFGTGAVKVTPSHDHTDWELGKKHQLQFKQVIGPDGRMMTDTKAYAGLKVLEAREKILEDLKKHDLLEKVTDYQLRQPVGDRSGAVIEPLPSTQWFVKTTAIRDRAMQVVKNGEIQFLPKNLEKVYFHWLENLHDWCISRQIWWGHQLPVFFCEKNQAEIKDQKSKTKNKAENFIVAREKPMRCPICGDCDMLQSEDVLDTWFSSSLWPFSTLGWPASASPFAKATEDKNDSAGKPQEFTGDLKEFFPTTLMETGADLIFFWVARMIMMSLVLTDEIPFKKVYFHGLILDEKGQKMSKSKGNVTDPIALIDQYGADALRMSLIGGNSPGLAQKYSQEKLLKYRNFVTKIWNASRFVALMCQSPAKEIKELSSAEKEFTEKLTTFEQKHQKLLDGLQISLALEELYEFFWNDFCSQFLETEKQVIKDSPDSPTAKNAQKVLIDSLVRLLTLIGDFAPFVVDQIHATLLKVK